MKKANISAKKAVALFLCFNIAALQTPVFSEADPALTNSTPQLPGVNPENVQTDDNPIVTNSNASEAGPISAAAPAPSALSNVEGVIDLSATQIPIGLTSHYAAVANTPDGFKIYSANWQDGTISVINANDHTVKTITLPPYSAWKLASPRYGYLVGTTMYFVDTYNNCLWAIATATDTLIGERIELGGAPYNAISHGDKLYVNSMTTHYVNVVDSKTNTVIASLYVGAGSLDSILNGDKIIVSLTSGVAIIDTTKINQPGVNPVTLVREVTESSGGSSILGTFAFIQHNHLNDIISILDISKPAAESFVGRLSFGTGLRTSIAFSAGSKIYFSVSAGQRTNQPSGDITSHRLYVLDTEKPIRDGTGKIISFETTPIDITFPDNHEIGFGESRIIGNKLYVADFSGSDVYVIDLKDNRVLKRIPVGLRPAQLRLVGSELYILHSSEEFADVIDLRTDTLVDLRQANLRSFSSTASDGFYTSSSAPIDITANFDKPLAVGATMTVNLNTGATVTLNQIVNNADGTSSLSGKYTIAVGDKTADLAVESITSANISTLDPAAPAKTNYFLPSTTGDLVAENSIITRNLGDIKNISIGEEVINMDVGKNPYSISAPVTVGGVDYLYVANQGAGSVSVINASTNKEVQRITVGSEPYGLASAVVNGVTFMYVANTGSNSVSVINTSTNTRVDTDSTQPGDQDIEVGVKPYYVASLNGKIYVTNSLSNSVSVIDVASNTAEPLAIAVGSYPRAIKVYAGRYLYVANYGDPNYDGGNSVSVIDTQDNNKTKTIMLPVGQAGPRGVQVVGDKVYVTNYLTNNVSVINALTNTIEESPIPVGKGPRGILATPTKLYVENFDEGTITIITLATGEKKTVNVGHSPSGMSLSKDGKDLYVSSFDDGKVYILDTKTDTLKTSQSIAPTAAFSVSIQDDSAVMKAYRTIAIDVMSDNTATVSITSPWTGTSVFSGVYDGSKVVLSNISPVYQAPNSQWTFNLDPQTHKVTSYKIDSSNAYGPSFFTSSYAYDTQDRLTSIIYTGTASAGNVYSDGWKTIHLFSYDYETHLQTAAGAYLPITAIFPSEINPATIIPLITSKWVRSFDAAGNPLWNVSYDREVGQNWKLSMDAYSYKGQQDIVVDGVAYRMIMDAQGTGEAWLRKIMPDGSLSGPTRAEQIKIDYKQSLEVEMRDSGSALTVNDYNSLFAFFVNPIIDAYTLDYVKNLPEQGTVDLQASNGSDINLEIKIGANNQGTVKVNGVTLTAVLDTTTDTIYAEDLNSNPKRLFMFEVSKNASGVFRLDFIKIYKNILTAAGNNWAPESKDFRRTANWTQGPINKAPVAVAPVVPDFNVGTSKTIILNGSDVDGNALTYSIVTNPSNGTLVKDLSDTTGKTYIYAPSANYVGADSFAFKVSDGIMDSDAVTVSMKVIALPATGAATITLVSETIRGEYDFTKIYDVKDVSGKKIASITARGLLDGNFDVIFSIYDPSEKKMINGSFNPKLAPGEIYRKDAWARLLNSGWDEILKQANSESLNFFANESDMYSETNPFIILEAQRNTTTGIFLPIRSSAYVFNAALLPVLPDTFKFTLDGNRYEVVKDGSVYVVNPVIDVKLRATSIFLNNSIKQSKVSFSMLIQPDNKVVLTIGDDTYYDAIYDEANQVVSVKGLKGYDTGDVKNVFIKLQPTGGSTANVTSLFIDNLSPNGGFARYAYSFVNNDFKEIYHFVSVNVSAAQAYLDSIGTFGNAIRLNEEITTYVNFQLREKISALSGVALTQKTFYLYKNLTDVGYSYIGTFYITRANSTDPWLTPTSPLTVPYYGALGTTIIPGSIMLDGKIYNLTFANGNVTFVLVS